jgi:hypothetical protein
MKTDIECAESDIADGNVIHLLETAPIQACVDSVRAS